MYKLSIKLLTVKFCNRAEEETKLIDKQGNTFFKSIFFNTFSIYNLEQNLTIKNKIDLYSDDKPFNPKRLTLKKLTHRFKRTHTSS